MTRAFRRFIARLGIAALLFMQLAVAAYACPGVFGSSDSPQGMTAAAQPMPETDCMTLEQSQPNLCVQHCQQDSQVPGHSSPPLGLSVDLPLLAVVPVEAPLMPVALDVHPEFLAHATAPPPSIRFCVYRS